MLLKGVLWHVPRLSPSGGTCAGESGGDLRLRRGRIAELGRGLLPRRREKVLDLAGYRILPGLINAHDHLALNLLPHLGDPPYASIYRFAEEVYRPERSPIRQTLRASVSDRLWWGGYKNLISGVTTVVHHDPFPRRILLRPGFPVSVLRRYGWSHSLGFGEEPAAAHARAGDKPFIIHAAEGTDAQSHGEIDRLAELGVLAENTVLVHGIALTGAQRSRLAAAGCSLVWCPASNLRLYGRTAPIVELAGRLRLALGTDSTLTGSPTLLDEARAAAETGLASGDEILGMVTAGAARIFGLGGGRGRIEEGAAADLTVVPDAAGGAAQALLAARPADLALVTVAGRPRLARPEVAAELGLGAANAAVAGEPRWLIGDPAALRRRLEAAAGREVVAASPLGALLDCYTPTVQP